MYEAEDINGVILNYAVPNEGSNIWFDGWCMPKGANKKLACAFLDYISSPENAWMNMEYIGYTSPITGEYVFNQVLDAYDVYHLEDADTTDAVAVDISYYFDNIDGPAIVNIPQSERNRLFDTQYPSEDVINRCTIMQCFTAEEDKRVNDMWNRVKAGEIDLYLIIIGITAVIAVVAFILLHLYRKDVFVGRPPKGYRRIA
jgi:spermidine/putrescine transport system substrate-binding protein